MLGEKLNIFLSVGGFVVGMLGFVSGVFFYLKGKNKKILEYRVNSKALISVEHIKEPKIKLLYDEQPIYKLTLTRVKFKNSGNQTITFNDFAAQAQLCIKVSRPFPGSTPQFEIDTDNPNSGISVNPINKNLACIYFDFLKPKQVFKITFLHDGDIDILGELISGKIKRRRELPKMPDGLFTVIFTIIVVVVLTTWYTQQFPLEPYQMVGNFLYICWVICFVIYLLISFIGWILSKISRKK